MLPLSCYLSPGAHLVQPHLSMVAGALMEGENVAFGPGEIVGPQVRI